MAPGTPKQNAGKGPQGVAASPAPSPARPKMLKDQKFLFMVGKIERPRDRMLVFILNVFILFAILSFLVVQQTRTDLPALHPAGGTIREKSEDEEQEEMYEQQPGPPGGARVQLDPHKLQAGDNGGEWDQVEYAEGDDEEVVYEDVEA